MASTPCERAVYVHQPYCLLDLSLEQLDAMDMSTAHTAMSSPCEESMFETSGLSLSSAVDSSMWSAHDGGSYAAGQWSPLSHPSDEGTKDMILSRRNTPVYMQHLVHHPCGAPSPTTDVPQCRDPHAQPVGACHIPEVPRMADPMPPLVIPELAASTAEALRRVACAVAAQHQRQQQQQHQQRVSSSIVMPVLAHLSGKGDVAACTIKPARKPDGAVSDHPCRDFARGVCRRGSVCRFAHEGATCEEDKGEVCKDYLRGACVRDHCRFIHATRRATKKSKAPSENDERPASPTHVA